MSNVNVSDLAQEVCKLQALPDDVNDIIVARIGCDNDNRGKIGCDGDLRCTIDRRYDYQVLLFSNDLDPATKPL